MDKRCEAAIATSKRQIEVVAQKDHEHPDEPRSQEDMRRLSTAIRTLEGACSGCDRHLLFGKWLCLRGTVSIDLLKRFSISLETYLLWQYDWICTTTKQQPPLAILKVTAHVLLFRRLYELQPDGAGREAITLIVASDPHACDLHALHDTTLKPLVFSWFLLALLLSQNNGVVVSEPVSTTSSVCTSRRSVCSVRQFSGFACMCPMQRDLLLFARTSAQALEVS